MIDSEPKSLDRRLPEEVLDLLRHRPAGEAGPDERELEAALALAAGSWLLTHGDLHGAWEHLKRAAASPARSALGALTQQLGRLAQAATAQRESDLALTASHKLAEVDPRVGSGPLAASLARAGREEEAIAELRRAVEMPGGDQGLRLQLARLLHRSGRTEAAIEACLDLVEAAPTAKHYLLAAEQLRQLALSAAADQPALRIALVGNATLNQLASCLTVESWRLGRRPELFIGGFDQYMRELLEPGSDLYAFQPDVVGLAIHSSRLFPALHEYPFDLSQSERQSAVDAGIARLHELLVAFTTRSSALLLVHGMVSPRYPAIGILDRRDELGQAAIFAELNGRIGELVRGFANVYLLDEDLVQSRAGKTRATDSRFWLAGRIPWSDDALVGLTREYARYLRAFLGATRKCIVVDLDGTLWGGVLGEDGPDGIEIGAESPGNAFSAFQRELLRLWRRGILLALSSKNDLDPVLSVLAEHPAMLIRPHHLAALRVGWQDKATAIREIAKELNIGLDSIVFLDDNPAERALVRAELPQVMTPDLPPDPALRREFLLELDVFESLALTEEDRRRGELYAEERARREFESSHSQTGGLGEYLAELDIEVRVDSEVTAVLPRLAQLCRKTNQFNVTTRRHSEADLSKLIRQRRQLYAVRVRDRFGDSGLTGLAVVDTNAPDTWTIEDLLLSCRVLGRGVESALLAHIAEHARRAGATRLRGHFVPTARNTPARDLFERHGFALCTADSEGPELWEVNLSASVLDPPTWLRITSGEAAPEPAHFSANGAGRSD